ncbi:hypothetical protein PAMP_021644 [Pampus punctatissimus]
MDAFRVGGRRYRNSPSVCSDVDIGYDTTEDRCHREESESGGAADDKHRGMTDDGKSSDDSSPAEILRRQSPHSLLFVQSPAEAPAPSRLSLPYKVMKSLDGEVYRNVEFDVWQDTCKEMQKTDYMVFAGRQYFLGDKCQVRLEPKGKYYNAFIQEVGTHSSAVTVFIEELGEKHLVPLTDLKPVNPVPAWNVATPTRKGDLDSDARGQRHHRHRYFRKSRGSGGLKGAELLMPPPSSYGGPAPSALPPRFQPAGHHRPPPPPSHGAMTYDPYAPPHHHHPTTRAPRYGASSRSRRQLAAALNKECQFGFPAETVDEPADLDAAIAYYQLDDTNGTVFPPLSGQSVAPPPNMGAPAPPAGSYRVQRGTPPPPPAPPPGNTPVCSSEEDQEDTSTIEDQAEYTDEYIYSTQDQSYQTSGGYTAAEPSSNQDEQVGGAADSPPRAEMNYSYTQQVVKPLTVICSSPSSSSSSPSSSSSRVPAAAHLPPAAHTQPRSVAMAIPAASPWLVNELGEPLCTVVAPPPYSYDPNGSDLPRGQSISLHQWYHQSCWQQQQQQVYPTTTQEASYPYQHYLPYLSQDPPLHAAPPSYPEAGRGPHQPPSSYPESTRAGDGQMDGHGSGPTHPMEGSSSIGPTPSSSLMYPEQTPVTPPQLLHLPYETPPPTAYLPTAPPPALPHTHLTHHSSYHPCLPPSTHWGALQTGGHAPRMYCPAPMLH